MGGGVEWPMPLFHADLFGLARISPPTPGHSLTQADIKLLAEDHCQEYGWHVCKCTIELAISGLLVRTECFHV
ncbi:unknown protein [Desulfotalea psychrophila LSv54]|uniref:Uncharacterized protein n=1 Tax=Desulfotalea psychrophila (strain LSv54 / DSM 12343) TaxID=177439 RepID=Q6AM65_DESPS|nr:unknown protein [Desulfotalea psychrophila LSv54]